MRKTKVTRVPEVYRCGNPECKRTTPMVVASYMGYPPAGTPEDRIHREQQPLYPPFSILCASCAHYTVVTPNDPRSG